MLDTLRGMPNGVRVFLVYALVLLSLLGLTLPLVVNEAVEAPISFVGLVWMVLLAYAIFTITLVLQRKQAAWMLALGLCSLTLPLVPLLAVAAGLPGLIFALVLAVILFRALWPRSVRAWFNET
ncbi:MAG TPA: hypothetical protein VK592_10270 [Candidatus Dormibacteraeota bacterium]|nr:hypothetical protein [Candidatus Dormibacteraeota bacterium]